MRLSISSLSALLPSCISSTNFTTSGLVPGGIKSGELGLVTPSMPKSLPIASALARSSCSSAFVDNELETASDIIPPPVVIDRPKPTKAPPAKASPTPSK